MAILDATTKSLRIILGEAKGTLDCDIVAFWGAQTGTGFQPASNDLVSNGTTAVTVVPAPGAGEQRQVNEVRLFNNDTITHNVTLQFDNGGTIRVLEATPIAAGGEFLYTPTRINEQSTARPVYLANAVSNAVTLTGTSQAGALPIVAGDTFISSTPTNTGAVMPPIGTVVATGTVQIGTGLRIWNAGAHTGTIYGNGAQTIDTIAGTIGVPLSAGNRALFVANSATTWISALLGTISS